MLYPLSYGGGMDPPKCTASVVAIESATTVDPQPSPST